MPTGQGWSAAPFARAARRFSKRSPRSLEMGFRFCLRFSRGAGLMICLCSSAFCRAVFQPQCEVPSPSLLEHFHFVSLHSRVLYFVSLHIALRRAAAGWRVPFASAARPPANGKRKGAGWGCACGSVPRAPCWCSLLTGISTSVSRLLRGDERTSDETGVVSRAPPPAGRLRRGVRARVGCAPARQAEALAPRRPHAVRERRRRRQTGHVPLD